MDLQHILAVILLIIALVSLTVYAATFVGLLHGDPPVGMVRTAVCRIISAMMYIGLGMTSLIRSGDDSCGRRTPSRTLCWPDVSVDTG